MIKPSEETNLIELELLIAKDAELKNYMISLEDGEKQEVDVFTNIPGLATFHKEDLRLSAEMRDSDYTTQRILETHGIKTDSEKPRVMIDYTSSIASNTVDAENSVQKKIV